MPEVKTFCIEDQKARDLYYKLHKCLEISITAGTQPNSDNLSCHANNMIRHLAKSIESGETWYDASVDAWCDYFIKTPIAGRNVQNFTDAEATVVKKRLELRYITQITLKLNRSRLKAGMSIARRVKHLTEYAG